MDEYIDMLKALSDETRLRIIVLLSEKELCVCQIEAALVLSQAKVSRHLTVLKHAGLVSARRAGLWSYYSIAKPRNCLEEKMFSCFKACLRKEAFFRKDLISARRCSSRPL